MERKIDVSQFSKLEFGLWGYRKVRILGFKWKVLALIKTLGGKPQFFRNACS